MCDEEVVKGIDIRRVLFLMNAAYFLNSVFQDAACKKEKIEEYLTKLDEAMKAHVEVGV